LLKGVVEDETTVKGVKRGLAPFDLKLSKEKIYKKRKE